MNMSAEEEEEQSGEGPLGSRGGVAQLRNGLRARIAQLDDSRLGVLECRQSDDHEPEPDLQQPANAQHAHDNQSTDHDKRRHVTRIILYETDFLSLRIDLPGFMARILEWTRTE